MFRCQECSAQFVRRYQSLKWTRQLFREYTLGKQTLTQLANKYGKTRETIRKYLDRHRERSTTSLVAGPVIIGVDCSFFGRGYGIILVRCPNLRKNLYWKEVTTENKTVYEEARKYLEAAGFSIQAVVLDAKSGIRQAFTGLIIQICQYHQQQIIRRYLTSKPKTQAGAELKLITDMLTKLTEPVFTQLLSEWHQKWNDFLKERTFANDGKHWWYTHKRLRSAYRSLGTNLPYLFSYRKHPDLRIPNTNNSLEGYFSRIKQLLNNHHGLKRHRRYRVIQSILKN